MAHDPYFRCGYSGCTKTMHRTDDNILVTVLIDSQETEQKRFCCLDHLAEWAKFRENFPLQKKIRVPKKYRKPRQPKSPNCFKHS